MDEVEKLVKEWLQVSGYSHDLYYKLVEVGSPAIPSLVKILEDVDKGVFGRSPELLQGHTASVLARIAEKNPGMPEYQEAIPSMIRLMAHENGCNNNNAVIVLGATGSAAVPVLIEALRSSNEKLQYQAAWALEEIWKWDRAKISEAVLVLIDKLENSSNEKVRGMAAKALGEARDKSAVDALIGVLKDRYGKLELQEYAVEALEKIGCEKAVDGLIRKMEDILQEWETDKREKIARVIGKIIKKNPKHDWGPFIPKLIWVLRNRKDDMREHAAWLLGEIGKPAVLALIERLNHWDQYDQIVAAWALGKIGDLDAIPALTKKLKDKNMGVQVTAAWALGQIGEQEFEEMTCMYLERKIPHEVYNQFCKSLQEKLPNVSFEKGCVAPPKKAPRNPDEMKRIALRRICGKTRPKTGNRKPETLRRCIAGG